MAATIVQHKEAANAASALSITVTLTAAPTSGNTLVLIGDALATFATPSGWTKIESGLSYTELALWTKTSNGSETSTVLSLAGSTPVAIAAQVIEVSGLAGVDVHTDNTTMSGTTISTGTTATSTQAANLVIAAFGSPWNSTVDNIQSVTNSFTILATTHSTLGGSSDVGLTSATYTSSAAAAFSTTGSYQTGGGNNASALIVVFKVDSGTHVPGAPTGVSATAGDGLAVVTFTAPSTDGGSAITGYTATSTPGGLTGTVSGASAAPITVSGLSNGTSYTFTVHATNAVGNSAESSPSSSVTPQAFYLTTSIRRL